MVTDNLKKLAPDAEMEKNLALSEAMTELKRHPSSWDDSLANWLIRRDVCDHDISGSDSLARVVVSNLDVLRTSVELWVL